jgi:hypothetical protein
MNDEFETICNNDIMCTGSPEGDTPCRDLKLFVCYVDTIL